MYGKLFQTIFDGSLRSDPMVRLVFMDMVILADQDGIVDMTHEALAARTNVDLKIIYEAIKQLENPDPRSRSPKEDGVRIKRLDGHRDWGWQLINYEYYLKKGTRADKNERDRIRMAGKRKQNKDVAKRSEPSPSVADVAHIDIDIDIDKDIKKKHTKKKKVCVWPKDFKLTANMKTYAINQGINPEKVDAFFDDFKDWAKAKGAVYKDWQAAFRIRIGKAPEYGKQFISQTSLDPDKQKLTEGSRMAAERLRRFKQNG